MKCEICNEEMEHINDIGLRCMNCDLDQEPIKEVYVVVRMWRGLIDDVNVYKNEPQGTEEIDEHNDNGEHVYYLTIEDKYNG
tara:strand:+ start:10812 stop:11057 length:246 start_codon:yes stop_codon:yes gene_type:complete